MKEQRSIDVRQSKTTLVQAYFEGKVEGVFKRNKKGEYILEALLCGGKKVSLQRQQNTQEQELLLRRLSECSGHLNPQAALYFINRVVEASLGDFQKHMFDNAIDFLMAMKPQDPVEARLLAQHFVLHEQGLFHTKLCAKSTHITASEHYLSIAKKMLKLSQESIQTLTNYRKKGSQQVNVVYMRDNSKAVMLGDMGKNEEKTS